MKKVLRTFLTLVILVGLINTVYTKSHENKETMVIKYKELLTNINGLLILNDDSYIYNYKDIEELVYNFDILSANEHLGGDWTHETFLNEIIGSLNSIDENFNFSNEYHNINTKSNCGINSVDTYWNYYRIWANQTRSNTLANKYISAANISGNVSTIAEFLAEGFKAVGLSGYSGTASVVSMLAGYHSNNRTSLANSIKNNNWNCGTMHEIDKFFVNVWKVEAQGIK